MHYFSLIFCIASTLIFLSVSFSSYIYFSSLQPLFIFKILSLGNKLFSISFFSYSPKGTAYVVSKNIIIEPLLIAVHMGDFLVGMWWNSHTHLLLFREVRLILSKKLNLRNYKLYCYSFLKYLRHSYKFLSLDVFKRTTLEK